jgi:hypothetical protein
MTTAQSTSRASKRNTLTGGDAVWQVAQRQGGLKEDPHAVGEDLDGQHQRHAATPQAVHRVHKRGSWPSTLKPTD